MPGVCNLCGDYKNGLIISEWSSMPDLPARVAGDKYAVVCTSCSINISDADENVCGFCGSGNAIKIYEQNCSGVPQTGWLCNECFAIARGEYPPDFSEELRQTVREREGFECADCGMPQSKHREEFNQKLHVHHRDGDKRNNDPANLVPLCVRCHGSK